MKKKLASITALLLAVIMSASLLSACAKEEISAPPVETTAEMTTAADTSAPEDIGGPVDLPQTVETEATTATTTATTAATTKATTQATTQAPQTAAPVETTAATTAATVAPAPAGSVGKYVYNSLSSTEKSIYNQIVAGVKKHETTIKFDKSYDASEVKAVAYHVYYQEPTLMIAAAYDFTANSVSIKYDFTASEIATMQSGLDKAMAKIQSGFPSGAGEYDKVKVIHDYIVSNTNFSKDSPYSGYAYGPLVAGVGQCEGYAKAMAYACNYFGIENVRITGKKYNGLSHAWNKVKVNGKWYNIDTTWDDPMENENHIRYTFFLVPDSDVVNSYILECDFTPPAATSWDANYFVVRGYYATSSADATTKMQKAVIDAAKSKRTYIQIRCSSKEVYDAAYAAIITNGGYKNIVATAGSTTGCYKPTVKTFGDSSQVTTSRYIIELRVTY